MKAEQVSQWLLREKPVDQWLGIITQFECVLISAEGLAREHVVKRTPLSRTIHLLHLDFHDAVKLATHLFDAVDLKVAAGQKDRFGFLGRR